MKKINTFEELEEIQNEQYKIACSLDLLFIRTKIPLINGYALIIGANAPQYIEIYAIDNKLYEKNKKYIERYY